MSKIHTLLSNYFIWYSTDNLHLGV